MRATAASQPFYGPLRAAGLTYRACASDVAGFAGCTTIFSILMILPVLAVLRGACWERSPPPARERRESYTPFTPQAADAPPAATPVDTPFTPPAVPAYRGSSRHYAN